MKAISSAPWDTWVKRVILHAHHYLSWDGEPTAGGRQRKIVDMARIIREDWGREVVIAQKGAKGFDTTDPDGNRVIGVKVTLNTMGDRALAKATREMVGEGDAMVYMGNEDAWPHFVQNAKVMHVGVWWDGPFSWLKRAYNKRRTLGLARACRSILCVDTNTINWIRCQGPEGLALCNKCVYVPNNVDLTRLPLGETERDPHEPLRLLWARRYEFKRGPELFLDTLKVLKDRGFPFASTMCLAQGQSKVELATKEIAARGLQDDIDVQVHGMDSVLEVYQHADVALVPTIWSEGTSYSAVEALAAGLPVVTTPVGGLANLVFPDHNGFVVAPTPATMADAVMRFADHDLWRRMRQNCLAMRPALSYDRWHAQILDWLKT